MQVIDLQNRALLVIIRWKVRKIRSEEDYVNNKDTLPAPSLAGKNLSTEILIGADFLLIERIFEKFMYIQNNNGSGKVLIFGDLE